MTSKTTELSEKLDELSEKVGAVDIGAANRLRQLRLALADGVLAEEWAAVDIYRLIDPRDIVEQIRAQAANDRIVALLEIIRNVTLFLPILVTWFGVSRAVDSYYALIQRSPSSAQTPFIYLWQNGFGEQAWPTLGQLGFINAFILCIVIGLTITTLVRAEYRTRARDRYAEGIRRELAEVLSLSTLYLQRLSRRTPTSLIEHFRDAIEKIIGQLEAERMRISDLAEQRDRELSLLTQFSADLRISSDQLLETAQRSEITHRTLAERVGNLALPVSQMATTAEQLLTAGRQIAAPMQELAKQQQQVGAQIANAVGALQKAASDLTTSAASALSTAKEMTQARKTFMEDMKAQRAAQEDLIKSVGENAHAMIIIGQSLYGLVGQLTTSIDQLTPSTTTLANQGDQLITHTKSLTDATRQIVSQQQALVEQLKGTLGNLQETMKNSALLLDRSITLYEHSSEGQSALLNAIATERSAQVEIAQVVSRSITDFEATLKTMQATATSVHTIAVDLSELSRNVPPLTPNNRRSA